MRQYNFSFEQFVDNTSWNAAVGDAAMSIRQIGANVQPFFLSGVINPQNILFTFNSNLTVTVNGQSGASSPPACLFGNGSIATAHGINNGTDSSIYNVNMAPYVPGAGSVTAYIVASYAQVSLDVYTVLGAPPGHPDYASNFVPYIGYTRLEDTWNVTGTTTAPDNITNVELCRMTLSAGQTQITSVNTSFQVLAGLNAKTVVLGGDVTGLSNANTVSKLQGKTLSASSPGVNNLLLWNGSAWVPSPGPPAGGDLSGSYPNPVVDQSSAGTFTALGTLQVNESANVSGAMTAFSYSLSSNNASIFNSGAATFNGALSTGSNLQVNGNSNVNGVGVFGGAVAAAQASAYNQVLRMDQFVIDAQQNGYIEITGAFGGVERVLTIQWGFFTWVGWPGGASSKWSTGISIDTVSFPISYPNACLWATATLGTSDVTGFGAMIGQGVTLEVVGTGTLGSNSGMAIASDYINPGGGITTNIDNGAGSTGLTGFYWVAIGY